MENENPGKRRWGVRLIVVLAAAILLLLGLMAALMVWVDRLVDIWWFDALGYGLYYWQQLLYRYAVFAGVMLLFFLVFFLNFWIAARFLKDGPLPGQAPGGGQDRTRRRRLFTAFQTGSIWFYAPLSLVLSIPLALPLFRQWESFLFYIFSGSTGLRDPYFGKDIAFYLFSYPIYTLMQRRLLMALVILTAGLVLLYVAKNRLLGRPLLGFSRGARWHLSLLVLALFGFGIWEFMLQRYGLVYTTSHQDLFYGPGYVEMKVILPMIWACVVFLALTAVAVVVMIQRRRLYMTGLVVAVMLMAVLALRYTPLLPGLVQTYVVKPNEVEKESPYIAAQIRATLDAYRLNDIETRDFSYERLPAGEDAPKIDEVLANIPVWDQEILVEVYRQLQELRAYYTLPLVSVGRYRIEGSRQQVFLAPREIEFENLPGEAHNWINAHLTYTHGFGAVMTPASQVGGKPMTWYMQDIPPRSPFDLIPQQPRIYYGMETYNYSIVPNLAGEMDYPRGDSNVMTHYDGRGGVPVSSLLRKFLFAYHLKNKDVFFSTKITEKSRVLFRRNILERIRHLVPYLRLDGTPYVAVTGKGIYWIVDAYTTSSRYPAASPPMETRAFNYMRNAVKIIVDAYHGSVDFYIDDEDDPIIDTYKRIYPSLFKPMAALPDDLRPHMRYPTDFFDIQMQVYARYHQKDPRVFYQQEDLWTFTEVMIENRKMRLRPYYVTLDLIEANRMDFMLLVPLFPKNRDNLRAVAIAGSDPGRYGTLIIYNFPKGELVYGPAQIDALINQEPEIAEQFTLWDQSGSQLVRGKMIILPVGRSVIFIQPVYLRAASRVKIPELQRIIMSDGEVVVMETSVQRAYAELKRRVTREMGEEELEAPEAQPEQPREAPRPSPDTALEGPPPEGR